MNAENTDHPRSIASAICDSQDASKVAELISIASIGSAREKANAISTIGELGATCPELLVGHVSDLAAIASSGRGRLVWESATALAGIASVEPAVLMSCLPVLDKLTQGASVIARDKAVEALCALAESSYDSVWPILIATLRTSPVNQFPTYAERLEKVVAPSHVPMLVATIESRIGEMPNPAKQARLTRLLKRLS
jgi:hypothetical protein